MHGTALSLFQKIHTGDIIGKIWSNCVLFLCVKFEALFTKKAVIILVCEGG